MLQKLSSEQGHPSKKCIFGHVTSLVKMSSQHIQKISQGYCIHLPNMKRICLMAAKLLRKENADPAEPANPIYKQASLVGHLIITLDKVHND